MGLLRQFSRFPAAVESLTRTLEGMAELQRGAAPAEARLDDLERSRARWEADMQALLLKADSTLKAANNAESRSRTMLKHYEKLDPLGEEVEEVEATVRQPDASRSEEEGMLPVRLDLAANNKAHALNAKWGL